jgi:hypothetical protein
MHFALHFLYVFLIVLTMKRRQDRQKKFFATAKNISLAGIYRSSQTLLMKCITASRAKRLEGSLKKVEATHQLQHQPTSQANSLREME